MSVPALKEIILSAALGRTPKMANETAEFTKPLPRLFGDASYSPEPSGIEAVLPTYQQRRDRAVDTMKKFLMEDQTVGVTHRANILDTLLAKEESRWIMGRQEDMNLRLRIIDIAYKQQKDDDALTRLAAKAVDKSITPAEVLTEIESIQENIRLREARELENIMSGRPYIVRMGAKLFSEAFIHFERN